MSVIDKIKLDGTTYDVGKTPDTTLAVSGSPADAAKVGTELDKKVDKVTGKGLSTEDFTTAEKTKLTGIAEGATNVTVDTEPTENSTNAVSSGAVYDLKEDLSDAEGRLLDIDGKVITPAWVLGNRYVSSGAEVWASSSTRITMAQGEYVSFSEGDVVHIKDNTTYQICVAYSTDNGSTWSTTGWRDHDYIIVADCIGWVMLAGRSPITFTEDDLSTVPDAVIEIIHADTIGDTVSDNALLIEGLEKTLTDYSNFSLAGVGSGYEQVYISSSTSTTRGVGTTSLTGKMSVSQGDELTISATVTADVESNFGVIGIRVIEKSSSDTTLVYTDVTDISSGITYTVTHSSVSYVIVVVYWEKASSDVVSSGYYENFQYEVIVTKRTEESIYGALTESGDVWEV